ncbi:hypothetical protein BCU92_00335 [Vibrio cyclitrophicus]|uniref:hypothetical protein n=1 Tax=Vibrio cyclitrophicus TaxID=47951 RepID=UPI000C853B6A|nr:hypothetical protein [Vibrio cyclitrophicus]PMG46833.1 hypothetical protein BCU92_12695 [Vibrio cyclitrophicus]
MAKKERLIQFFDLDLFGKTRAKGMAKQIYPTPRTMPEIMGELKLLAKYNRAEGKLSSRSTKYFRLEEIKTQKVNGEEYSTLLINCIDPNAKNLVVNFTGKYSTSKRDIIRLGNKKGLETSVHIIIKHDKNSNKKHLALFEKSEHLGFLEVISFLNCLFKLAAKFNHTKYTKPHPNGANNKTINMFSKVTYLGHPSADFFNELESGIISNITLTSGLESVSGYDIKQHSELKEVRMTMGVKKSDIVFAGGNRKYLKRAIKIADSLKASEVRIAFKDQTGAHRSAKLDSSGQMYDSDRYVRKANILGGDDLWDTALQSIDAKLVSNMLGLVSP